MVKIGISNFEQRISNDEVVLFLGYEFSVAAFPEKTAFVAEISITDGFNLGNAAGVISKFDILRFDIRYSSPLRPRPHAIPAVLRVGKSQHQGRGELSLLIQSPSPQPSPIPD